MSSPRLTSLDASFLEVESPTAHMHVGWVCAFAHPAEGRAPRFPEIRDHVETRLHRAPRYRQKLAEVPLGLSDPVWADDPDFDVARHVRRARETDLRELTDRVMSEPLDRDRPLWELWVADRLDDGRIGMVGKVHHCMVDGIAAVELGSLLLDPTPEPPSLELDEWHPRPLPSGVTLLVGAAIDRIRRGARVATAPLGLVRRPRRALDALGTAVQTVRAVRHTLEPARPSGLNEPISGERHLARARRPFEDLRTAKKRFDASVNDVVLAAATGGVRRLFERRGEHPAPMKAMVPVSVRDEDGAGALGNQISFVFLDLPCDEPDPVRRIRDIKAGMDERKRGGEPRGAEALMAGVEYVPRTLQQAVARAASSARAFNLVVSNIPGPPQPLYMLGCELEEVYPVVPLADRHAVSIGFTTVGDQAFFGVYADRESLPEADELAKAVGESVDELCGRRVRGPRHMPEPAPVG